MMLSLCWIRHWPSHLTHCKTKSSDNCYSFQDYSSSCLQGTICFPFYHAPLIEASSSTAIHCPDVLLSSNPHLQANCLVWTITEARLSPLFSKNVPRIWKKKKKIHIKCLYKLEVLLMMILQQWSTNILTAFSGWTLAAALQRSDANRPDTLVSSMLELTNRNSFFRASCKHSQELSLFQNNVCFLPMPTPPKRRFDVFTS